MFSFIKETRIISNISQSRSVSFIKENRIISNISQSRSVSFIKETRIISNNNPRYLLTFTIISSYIDHYIFLN